MTPIIASNVLEMLRSTLVFYLGELRFNSAQPTSDIPYPANEVSKPSPNFGPEDLNNRKNGDA